MRYWIYWNDLVQGPFEVNELLALKAFTTDLPVCEEDQQEWSPAAAVAELLPYFQTSYAVTISPTAPPPPPPSQPPLSVPLQGEFFHESSGQEHLFESNGHSRYEFRPAQEPGDPAIETPPIVMTTPFRFSSIILSPIPPGVVSAAPVSPPDVIALPPSFHVSEAERGILEPESLPSDEPPSAPPPVVLTPAPPPQPAQTSPPTPAPVPKPVVRGPRKPEPSEPAAVPFSDLVSKPIYQPPRPQPRVTPEAEYVGHSLPPPFQLPVEPPAPRLWPWILGVSIVMLIGGGFAYRHFLTERPSQNTASQTPVGTVPNLERSKSWGQSPISKGVSPGDSPQVQSPRVNFEPQPHSLLPPAENLPPPAPPVNVVEQPKKKMVFVELPAPSRKRVKPPAPAPVVAPVPAPAPAPPVTREPEPAPAPAPAPDPVAPPVAKPEPPSPPAASVDAWSGKEQEAIAWVLKQKIYNGKRTIGDNARLMLDQMHEKELLHAADTGERLYHPDKLSWTALHEIGPRYRVYLTFMAWQASGERVQARMDGFLVDLDKKTVAPADDATRHDFFDLQAMPQYKPNAKAGDIEAILSAVDVLNRQKVRAVILKSSLRNKDEQKIMQTAAQSAEAKLQRAVVYFRTKYAEKTLQNVAKAYAFESTLKGK